MQSLEKIEEKRLKVFTDRQHKLLGKAMSSVASGCKKEEINGAFHLSELAGQTSDFDNEIGFFQRFLPKNHLVPLHYLGFD